MAFVGLMVIPLGRGYPATEGELLRFGFGGSGGSELDIFDMNKEEFFVKFKTSGLGEMSLSIDSVTGDIVTVFGELFVPEFGFEWISIVFNTL